MRYKATPQGQTASYSILLCHQEEKQWGTQQKANIPRKQKNKKGENFLSKPSRPLNVTVLYISTIEIQKWSTLWQIYFTGQKEREVQLHFYSTGFQKYGGGNACSYTPPPSPSPLCSSARTNCFSSQKKKVSHPFAPLFFFFFEILNRLKTKQNQKKSFIVKSVLWSLVCWIDFLLPVWGVSGEWKPFQRLLFWNWPLLARPPPPAFFCQSPCGKAVERFARFLFCCSLAV